MNEALDYVEMKEWQPFNFNNGTIGFIMLTQDIFPETPVTIQYGFNGKIRHADWDSQGTIVLFQSQDDADEGAALIKENKDIIPISKFDHSGVVFGIMGTLDNVYYTEWDLTRYAGVWIPDGDVYANIAAEENKEETLRDYCKGVLETFTSWSNGDVYHYFAHVYKLVYENDGTPIEDFYYYENNNAPSLCSDSCSGYYSIKDAITDALGNIRP